MIEAPSATRRTRLVFVRGLELVARRGVHPHEKAAPQRVVIGVELSVFDESAPDGVGPDALERVVDYQAVVNVARAAVAAGHVMLVETLAETIAATALRDPRVIQARVTIEKPDAFEDVLSVGVVIERTRA